MPKELTPYQLAEQKMLTMMERFQDDLDWKITPITDNPSWQSFNQENQG